MGIGRYFRRFTTCAAMALVIATVGVVGPVGATGGDHSVIYVSPARGTDRAPRAQGADDRGDGGCRQAPFHSIGAAVAAAPNGGTVVVCKGTYVEDVIVGKALHLVGQHATVDATGLENAIQVVASDVSVRGFTLENANGEGFLAGIDSFDDIGLLPVGGPVLHGVTVEDNAVINNDKGFNGTESGNCKYAGDCGGGLHLNGTTRSTVRGNTVTGNADGILLTDDYAPNSYNTVAHNVVNDNLHECGIVLPSHSASAVSFDPTTFQVLGRNPTMGGVYGNLVIDNIADGNGTDKAPPEFGGGGSGSGIGLFGSGPGSAVYDNLVVGNEASGNGLAGIAMHAHHPGGEDINGNVLAFNRLGTNNLGGDGFDGPPTMDFQTTGIAIYSVPPAQLTIAANLIHDNAIGIWLSTTIDAVGLGSNHFHDVTTAVVTG